MGKRPYGPEKSCGAILYQREADGGIRYLIVETRGGHVSFPKGHVEDGENELETARREIWEETGVRDVTFRDGFRVTYAYKTPSGNPKDVIYYLAEFHADALERQEAEIGKIWVVPFEEAVELVNTPVERSFLAMANGELTGDRP